MARHHEPTYTVQLGPTFTPEVAGELAAWAELTGMTVSVTTRTATERGLELLRDEWARACKRRPQPARLRQLVAEAAERGKRQTARRRRNDAARRVAAVETSLPDTA